MNSALFEDIISKHKLWLDSRGQIGSKAIFDNQDLNSLEISDVDFFLFHQASKVVMENIIRKLKLDRDKFLTNYHECGNTISCTIPILLRQKIDEGLIHRGNKLMMFGFGVGYSYGACIVDY